MRFISIRIIGLISSLLLGQEVLLAQSNPNSIYSRFGLGWMDNHSPIAQFGMGGSHQAIADGSTINLHNPAASAFLDQTCLQISARGGYTTASNQWERSSYGDGQIHEMSMGFKKPSGKWSFVFGLSPYSRVGYTLSYKDTLSDTLIAAYKYKGNGGLSRTTFGMSRQFRFTTGIKKSDDGSRDSSHLRAHQLALGCNLNYLFGNISRENQVIFNNTENYATLHKVNLWTQGLSLDIGVHYRVALWTVRDEKKRMKGGGVLQLGATYSQQSNLYAEYSESLTSLRVFSSATLKDTALHVETTGRLKIPKKIALGAALRLWGRDWGSLILSGDFILQNWADYRLDLTTDAQLDNGLHQSTSQHFGLEFRPAAERSTGFLAKGQYRFGYRRSTTPLRLSGNNILQTGYSAGWSMPILNTSSKIHIGAEYCITGTTAAGLVQENYLQMAIGVSLSPSIFDRWFRQIKYD
jgi:hypothetical protein